MMKQKREWEATSRELQNFRGEVSIKHVDNVDAEIALKPGDIAAGTVHYFQDFRIRKYLVQTG